MRSLALLAVLTLCLGARAQEPAECVDPFIGTTNFGTTNPGAVTPHGMMSVVPFNVMGSEENVYDKDARWWSTPYEYHNKFFSLCSSRSSPDLLCRSLRPGTDQQLRK